MAVKFSIAFIGFFTSYGDLDSSAKSIKVNNDINNIVQPTSSDPTMTALFDSNHALRIDKIDVDSSLINWNGTEEAPVGEKQRPAPLYTA